MTARYLHFTAIPPQDFVLGAKRATPVDDSNFWVQKHSAEQIDRARERFRQQVGGIELLLVSMPSISAPGPGRVQEHMQLLQQLPAPLRTYAEAVLRGADREELAARINDFANEKVRWERRNEGIYEDVRLAEFPDAPSRRRCMFLFNADPAAFAAKYGFAGLGRTLIEVEPVAGSSKVLVTSMDLLDLGPGDEGQVRGAARSYWRGGSADPFSTEVLVEGEYVVTRVIAAVF